MKRLALILAAVAATALTGCSGLYAATGYDFDIEQYKADVAKCPEVKGRRACEDAAHKRAWK